MSIDNTADQQAEDTQVSADETENSTNEDTETTENAASTQEDSGDGEKQELSPYERELAKLRKRDEEREKELAKKDEIIEHKNRALEATKKQLKEAKPSEVEELKAKIAKLESRVGGDEAKRLISTLTTDQAERELIEHHYNSSIVKTGNLVDDIQNALALANRSVVMEQKRNRAIEEGNENFLASFAKGGAVKGDQPGVTLNPIQRQAEDLVRSINPNAVQFVKDQFTK